MEALTIPVKLYVHYTSNTYIENNWLVSVCDMSQLYPDQYVLICIRDINIEIEQPEPIDIIGLQVTQLNNQKENVISKAQQEINLLEDKIQQLLCIEHSPIEENEFPF